MQLFVSISLDDLSRKLTLDLKSEKLGVFENQWIVTQTEGTNKRLRQQIADNIGIAANIRFVNMKDILLKLYYLLCPGAPVLIDRERMMWAIYMSLSEDAFIQRFPQISSYYENNESHRVALAMEMADLFDQYQIYRHEKITAWKKSVQESDADLSWQAYLWDRMRERLGKNYADQIDVSTRLIEKIKDPNAAEIIKSALPQLRFFGLAIVTPYYLEIFSALAKVIEVKFYILNPSPEHLWMDDVSDKKIAALRNRPDLLELRTEGNELLINWGEVLSESYKLLLSHDDYANVYEVIDDSASASENETLLTRIQSEIHNNISNANRTDIPEALLKDHSLHIVGCYTPVREVEVLYNYLIDVFKVEPQMGARDVAVMVSDINLYAPYIRAVFDNAPIQIPYVISDESVAQGNTLFTALRDILNVNPETFKSEDVLSLLDSSYIRKRFGFSDITAVRQAVREAGIFFGHSALSPASSDPATETWMVSWNYGLKKIMYGLCMSGETLYDDGEQELYPLDTAEGSAMADRIRLYQFIQSLIRLIDNTIQSRTIGEWANYLGEIMKEMILDEEEDDDDFPRFANLLESISAMSEIVNEPISYQVFRQVFLSKLEQESRSGLYGGKGINFSSMVPMRSIPYKVIAMLGMDFDKFPRQDSILSFSLLNKGSRLSGDRSTYRNDKHLFLETLLAARERLYISYLSGNAQKGNEQPPSAIVDELLDYIALKTDDQEEFKKYKIQKHPLHLFSSKYREPQYALPPNYLGNTLVSDKVFDLNESAQQDPPDFAEVSLDQIAYFFNHPIKYYFNKILGIYFIDEDERLSDTEIFEPNHLLQWSIQQDFITGEPDMELYVQQKKRKGELPLATAGYVWVDNMKNMAEPFVLRFRTIVNGEPVRKIQIDHTVAGTIIRGSVDIYGNNYIGLYNSKSALKQIMAHWVRYLFVRVQESAPLDFYFLFKDVNNNQAELYIPANLITDEQATDITNRLLAYFKEGHFRLLPFYPLIAYLYYAKPVTSDPSDRNIAVDELKYVYENKDNIEQYGLGKKIFGDDRYLKRAIETKLESFSFLSPDSVSMMNFLIPDLMETLFVNGPDVFKLK